MSDLCFSKIHFQKSENKLLEGENLTFSVGL